MSLYLAPPKIDPRDYLSAGEALKTAAIRLTSPPGYWDDEIRQTLMREHPYVPSDRVLVNFTQRDDATGTAIGYISISGSPTVSIPVIIKNRELSPLDVMIVRSPTTHSNPGQDQQGAGDMEDDKVLPLDETTFTQAMDAGQVGDVIPQHQITGAAYTEDASALRLPFRGRTVMSSLQVGKQCLPSLASILGVSEQQKEAFGKILGSASDVTAGFLINETSSVVDQWLNASAPANSPFHKVAAVEIARGTATVVNDIPVEIKTADFLAADVFLESEETKVAVAMDAFSLAHPEGGLKRWLIFEDGTYCSAPEKIAGVQLSGQAEAKAVTDMMVKAEGATLKLGQTLIFSFDDVIAAPVKLSNVRSREDQGIVELTLNDGLDNFKAILDRRIKHATYEGKTDTWIFPADVRILVLDGHATLMPLEPAKVAAAIERSLTDSLICNRGQFSLMVRGETFGSSQVSEEKIAAQLDTFLTNGSELMAQVKAASLVAHDGVGLVRFASNIPEVVEHIVKQAEAIAGLPAVLKADMKDLGIDFKLAVKLAAGIGDPDGVDAVLGAGFLTQDNLAEFVNLSDQFHETVSKLARLLLAIRMGFPGDETATVVAMKSLSRVAERLESAGQEV
jgi:hypothetical protein